LSARELQVLRLLAAGMSNQEIARKLVITVGTAKSHVHHIYSKLGAKDRLEAVIRAKELGLLP
jgi:LuxR family maltose regulon positive regulatory protein